MILQNNPDVICLIETHLHDDNKIDIPGYKYFGINRKLLNKNANRGSGGVGLLVKLELFSENFVTICAEIQETVIGLELVNKHTTERTIIYCTYLPLDTSRYGQQNENILNLLTIELYKNCDANTIILTGDFNARIGSKVDADMPNLPPRHPIDTGINAQGMKMLNFINDIRGCVVNGQITPHLDDFTSVGTKGRAVVDYNIVRQSDLDSVIKSEVINCNVLINENDWKHLVSDVSQVPDHNLLSLQIELSSVVRENLDDQNLGSPWKIDIKNRVYRKKGEGYMTSELAIKILPLLLQQLERWDDKSQEEIDVVYDEVTNFMMLEAKRSLSSKQKKRCDTEYKEYWCSELLVHWKRMHAAERSYNQSCKQGNSKQKKACKLKVFKDLRNKFNKLLKGKRGITIKD